MRVVRVTKSGRKTVSAHGLLDDDTVATAAVKLSAILGTGIYMWCERQIDAHEALAIAVAGTVHETQGAYDGPRVAEQLRVRCRLNVSSASAASPLRLLKALKRRDASELIEPVSMRNRFVVPGGYFDTQPADPFDNSGEAGINPALLAVADARPRPFNTGDLLLESFHAVDDTIYVTTLQDLVAARPSGVDERTWRRAVIERYFPPETEDRELFKWSQLSENQLREQRKTPPSKRKPIVTFVPMTGGTPVGKVGTEALMNAFAEMHATKSRPLLRFQGGGIDRPVARVHSSITDDEVAKMGTPPQREWVQALFRRDKGVAVLTVFSNGTYRLQVKFGYLESATIDDAAEYFTDVNDFLAYVSPMIRPVHRRHLCPSSSCYIQKPQLLETPSVLGGPKNGVYQIVQVKLPARCSLEDVAEAVRKSGYPSLKAVNTHAGYLHMQWTRSNSLRKASLVKNLIHHSAHDGGLSASRLEELAAELGLSKRDVADIAEAKFGRHSVMTLIRARLASDAELTVYVNGNDPDYGARTEQALSNMLRNCGKGRGQGGVTDWSATVSRSPESFDAREVVAESDLDEFYEFFDDDADDEAYGWNDSEETGAEGEEERAEGAASSANPGAGVKQKADILERLKKADPDVFAFPSRPGYVPYSMKCQKNNTSTRQPLVLTAEESAAAMRDSSDKGKKTMRDALTYRGLTYICPEKWCPVSGVARGLNEPCPDADEPEWTMWNNNYPAFQTGVAHPKGLCMPCCFGSQPKPGLKKWNYIKKCKEDAGESLELDSETPGSSKKSRGPRVKTGHINKADRLLDVGDFGFAPSELFPDGTADGLSTRPVRRGMGDRSVATLARSLAFVMGYRSARALKEALAKRLAPQHFIQGDVREFMLNEDAERANSAPEAEVRRWMTEEYSRAMSIKRSAMTNTQVRREARIMLAHRECIRRLADHEDNEVSDVSLLRFVNSGALPDAKGGVALLQLDEAGNAFVEHMPERCMPAEGKIAAVLHRRGTYEPVGLRPSPTTFDPWWDASGAWAKRLFAAVRAVVPSPEGVVRAVSYSMMAVGAVVESGYMPFSRPVFVDPHFKHFHVSDVRLPKPASEAAAEEALRLTGDRFYSIAWKDVAATAQLDDKRDATVFAAPVEDRRTRTMAAVVSRAETVRRLATVLGEALDVSEFRPLAGETARDAVARVRKLALASLRDTDDATVQDDLLRGRKTGALDFAIETMLRPVPRGVPPTIKPAKEERITHQ